MAEKDWKKLADISVALLEKSSKNTAKQQGFRIRTIFKSCVISTHMIFQTIRGDVVDDPVCFLYFLRTSGAMHPDDL